MRTFNETPIWSDSLENYRSIIPIFNILERNKYWRLKEQLESSTGSICDNIAEGLERPSVKDKIKFLCYARASAAESYTQILRVEMLSLNAPINYQILLEQNKNILRQIQGLISYYKQKESKFSSI
ncbi:MAG: four helix bundle protein [Flavobacteriales bacterium]